MLQPRCANGRKWDRKYLFDIDQTNLATGACGDAKYEGEVGFHHPAVANRSSLSHLSAVLSQVLVP